MKKEFKMSILKSKQYLLAMYLALAKVEAGDMQEATSGGLQLAGVYRDYFHPNHGTPNDERALKLAKYGITNLAEQCDVDKFHALTTELYRTVTDDADIDNFRGNTKTKIQIYKTTTKFCGNKTTQTSLL